MPYPELSQPCQEFWSLHSFERQAFNQSLEHDGLDFNPRETILLLGKIRQLRGVVLQEQVLGNYQDYEDVSYETLTANLPLSLKPWEEATIQNALDLVLENRGKVEQIKERVVQETGDPQASEARKGQILFTLMTNKKATGVVVLLEDQTDTVSLFASEAEDRLAFKPKNVGGLFRSSACLHKAHTKGEGFFPFILSCDPTTLNHEKIHGLHDVLIEAFRQHYSPAWNKDTDEVMEAIVEAIQGSFDHLREYGQDERTIEIVAECLRLFQTYSLAQTQDEIIAYYYTDTERDFKEAIACLKREHQTLALDPDILYDYFHNEVISEHHTADLPEAQALIRETRRNYYQIIDQGVMAIEKLALFLKSAYLDQNLGFCNKDILAAIMRQNPITRWPAAVNLIMSAVNTPVLGQAFSQRLESDQLQAFYRELERPFFS